MKPGQGRALMCVGILMALAIGSCAALGGGAENAPIKASGMVEALEIQVASDLGGRVAEVFVDEGGMVEEGDPLLRLGSQVLENQLEGARANLAAAEAQHSLLVAQPLDAQRQQAIAMAELALLTAQENLKDLRQRGELQLAQVELDAAEARDALDDAEKDLRRNQPGNRAPQYMIKAAKAEVTIAEKRLKRAQKAFDQAHGKIAKAKAQIALSEAHRAYNLAVWHLDWLQSGADEIEEAILESNLEVAQQNVQDAKRELEEMDGGPDPNDLAKAEARVRAAEAGLQVARADTRDEQLSAAQAQVEAARAALAVVQAQVDELTLRAPSGGTVLARLVEPGEVVSPGAPAISIAQLSDLKVTVYVPEDRYGQINLGDAAEVRVDSFPDKTFEGVVTHIANQAEFTPRNVQTQEERQTTVYAIELKLSNPEGKLKPGMPADVTFTS
jgi:HlyD family secretion protein